MFEILNFQLQRGIPLMRISYSGLIVSALLCFFNKEVQVSFVRKHQSLAQSLSFVLAKSQNYSYCRMHWTDDLFIFITYLCVSFIFMFCSLQGALGWWFIDFYHLLIIHFYFYLLQGALGWWFIDFYHLLIIHFYLFFIYCRVHFITYLYLPFIFMFYLLQGALSRRWQQSSPLQLSVGCQFKT